MKKLKRLWPWLKGSRLAIILSLVFSSLATICKLAIPYIAGLLINYFADHRAHVCRPEDACRDESGLIPVLLLFVLGIVLVAGTIFRYIFDYTKVYIGQKVIFRMRKELFKAYLDAPIKEIDASSKGDLIQRLISDIENVQTGLLSGFAALYDGVTTVLVTLFFMFTLT